MEPDRCFEPDIEFDLWWQERASGKWVAVVADAATGELRVVCSVPALKTALRELLQARAALITVGLAHSS